MSFPCYRPPSSAPTDVAAGARAGRTYNRRTSRARGRSGALWPRGVAGLTRHPVKVEIGGSNPLGVASSVATGHDPPELLARRQSVQAEPHPPPTCRKQQQRSAQGTLSWASAGSDSGQHLSANVDSGPNGPSVHRYQCAREEDSGSYLGDGYLRPAPSRTDLTMEVDEPGQRLQEKQSGCRQADPDRPSPTPNRPERTHGWPAEQTQSNVVDARAKAEQNASHAATSREVEDVDIGCVERAKREQGHKESGAGASPQTSLPQKRAGAERDQEPWSAEIADRGPHAALAAVDY